jgi:hypothetical protein
MQKLIYVLWNTREDADDDFNGRLLGPLRAQLQSAGALRLQISVVDAAVSGGPQHVVRSTRPSPSACVSFWIHSVHHRVALEQAIASASHRLAGYAVAESTVKPNPVAAVDGQRTEGYSHFAMLKRPPRLTHEAWWEIWQRDQTRIGLETLGFFYYCQNIVTERLTYMAPEWDAIVEECYPWAALGDPIVFFNGSGSEETYRRNRERIMANSRKMCDFDKLDVILMSQYRIGGWADDPERVPLELPDCSATVTP